MIRDGNIPGAKLPDLLARSAVEGATGVLTLRSDGDQARIGLRQGKIHSADPSAPERPAQLEQFVYRMGLIDGVKHDVVARLRNEYGMSFDEVLIKGGVIDASLLAEIVAFKIREVLTDLLTWDALAVDFIPDAALYPGSRVDVRLDAETLGRELGERHGEWLRIACLFPGGDHRLGPTNASPGHPLERDQSVIYRMTGDSATLAGLTAASGLGRYRSCRAAYCLINSGYLSRL